MAGRTIIVSYTKALGDLIFALATLHSFRHGFRDDYLVLVAKDRQEPLARNLVGKVVDDVIVLEGSDGKGLSDVLSDVWQHHADLYIDLAGAFKSGIIMAGPRWAKKVRPAIRNMEHPLLWGLKPFSSSVGNPGIVHRVDEFLNFADYFELERKLCFDLCIGDDIGRAVEEQIVGPNDLRNHGCRGVIGINIGASKQDKRLHLDTYFDVAQSMISMGYRVVFFGSNKACYDYDRACSPVIDQFVEGRDGMALNMINISDKVDSVDQLLVDSYLLRYSGLFDCILGSDTGPMKIAGMVGNELEGGRIVHNRVVEAFTTTNAEKYRTYDATGRKYGVVVQALGLSCQPRGYQKRCSYRGKCELDMECVHGITVDRLRNIVVAQAEMTQTERRK